MWLGLTHLTHWVRFGGRCVADARAFALLRAMRVGHVVGALTETGFRLQTRPWSRTVIDPRMRLSTPEQKCITADGRKAPAAGAFAFRQLPRPDVCAWSTSLWIARLALQRSLVCVTSGRRLLMVSSRRADASLYPLTRYPPARSAHRAPCRGGPNPWVTKWTEVSSGCLVLDLFQTPFADVQTSKGVCEPLGRGFKSLPRTTGVTPVLNAVLGNEGSVSLYLAPVSASSGDSAAALTPLQRAVNA